MISMALAGQPRLLIADEPTTALDATVQKEILELLADLRDKEGLALILISHNLGAVGEIADDIAVMYGGRFIEQGPIAQVLRVTGHPYTQALWRARPQLNPDHRSIPLGLPGKPPLLNAAISGCAFAPRCPLATEAHFASRPMATPEPRHPDHTVACFLSADNRAKAWIHQESRAQGVGSRD